MGVEGGCQDGYLHASRPLQAEDKDKTGDEGWQARGLRQGRHGEGEARTEGCQGLPGQSAQGQHLSRYGGCVRLMPSPLSVGARGAVWRTGKDLVGVLTSAGLSQPGLVLARR